MIASYLVPKPARRVRRIDLDLDRFLALLRMMDGTRTFRVEGIPDDARAVGWLPPSTLSAALIQVFIESEAFDQVPEGGWPEQLLTKWIEVVPAGRTHR